MVSNSRQSWHRAPERLDPSAEPDTMTLGEHRSLTVAAPVPRPVARPVELVAVPVVDESWRARANCLGVDPALFFPERGEPTGQAKAVCAGCSVRAECLDYAIETTARFGIWGGCSEAERRVLRGQRARARAAERKAAS